MKKKSKKPAPSSNGKVVKTYSLTVNFEELVHLRDLFSVSLPPDMASTVSQFLATAEGKHFHEIKLWNKISQLCQSVGIPTEDDAPDYVIAPTGPAPMGVFRLQLTQDEEDAQQSGISIFDSKDETEALPAEEPKEVKEKIKSKPKRKKKKATK
jgi:hypothetical protein